MDSPICGILGLAGNGVIAKDHEVFEQLWRISTLRGRDGTGIFQGKFTKFGKPTWFVEKKPWEVNYFLQWCASQKGNKLVLRSLMDNIYIGHTRWATRGSYDEKNCHPFVFDNIVGVHNGTLVDKKYDDKSVVDSYLLYRDIASRGIKKVLEELDPNSAYALNFFDMDTNKVYFVRNSDRPLHFCKNKERNVAYWASEHEMLEFVLSRKGIKYTEVVTFRPGRIYSLDVNEDIKPGDDVAFIVEDFNLPVKPKKEAVSWTNPQSEYYKEWMNWSNGSYDEEDDSLSLFPASSIGVTDNTSNISSVNVKPKIKASSPDLTKINPKKGKINHETCISCGRDMGLVDQFFGVKVEIDGKSIYECSDCTRQGIEIKDVLQSDKDVSID